MKDFICDRAFGYGKRGICRSGCRDLLMDRRFFDSLDQEVLLREVGRVVDDPEIIGLIRMWIGIGYVRSSGD